MSQEGRSGRTISNNKNHKHEHGYRNMAQLRMTIDISNGTLLSRIAEPEHKSKPVAAKGRRVLPKNRSLNLSEEKPGFNQVAAAKTASRNKSVGSNGEGNFSAPITMRTPLPSHNSSKIMTFAARSLKQASLKKKLNTDFAPGNVESINATPRSSTTVSALSDLGSCTSTTARSKSKSATSSRNSNSQIQYGQSSKNPSPSLASPKTVNSVTVPHFDVKENPSFWTENTVQVLLRIRPLNGMEIARKSYNRCLEQKSNNSIIWLGPPKVCFTFDHVACETTTQEMLFKVAGVPMVENCMSGFNSCMFAYGQTGSGKTHTMIGDLEQSDQQSNRKRGIAPRIFEYLFGRIKLEEGTHGKEQIRYSCRCSFLEIYNEQITDLLEPSSTNLQIREDVKKGVYVEKLTEIEVKNVHDVLHLLIQGATNRKIACTKMNKESSRSHTVFTCVIESQGERDSVVSKRHARLNLVDLAGSERQKTSNTEGERLKEAANINKSLSTLGLVIMVLADKARGKHRHVPYRDSKLTFLLQDSLGGNSKTTIIANVSPSICSAYETLSTLKFAQRAKHIQNNAVVNEIAFGNLGASQKQIQMKMKSMEVALGDALRREEVADSEVKRLQAVIDQLNHQIHQKDTAIQWGKMMEHSREGSFGHLGSVANNEGITFIEEQSDHNLELAQLANENARLLEQLRRFQDFYEGGEREILLAEIANLREQLIEAFSGHFKFDNNSLSGPKVAKELDECRTHLIASFEANERLTREIDDLQLQMKELKNMCKQQQDELETLKRQAHTRLEEKATIQEQVLQGNSKINKQSGIVEKDLQLMVEIDDLKDRLKSTTEENVAIKSLCNEWEKAALRLSIYLEKEHQEVEVPAGKMHNISNSVYKRDIKLIYGVGKVMETLEEKQSEINSLQKQLQNYMKSTSDENGISIRPEQGANGITKTDELHDDAIPMEVLKLKSNLSEKLSIIQEMEKKAKCYMKKIEEANKKAFVAFLVLSNCNGRCETEQQRKHGPAVLLENALQASSQKINDPCSTKGEFEIDEIMLKERLASFIEPDDIHDKEIEVLKLHLNECLGHITLLQKRNKNLYDQVKFLETTLQQTQYECAKQLERLDKCQIGEIEETKYVCQDLEIRHDNIDLFNAKEGGTHICLESSHEQNDDFNEMARKGSVMYHGSFRNRDVKAECLYQEKEAISKNMNNDKSIELWSQDKLVRNREVMPGITAGKVAIEEVSQEHFKSLLLQKTEDLCLNSLANLEVRLCSVQQKTLNIEKMYMNMIENILCNVSAVERKVHSFFSLAEELEARYKNLGSKSDLLTNKLQKKDKALKKLQIDFSLLQEYTSKVLNEKEIAQEMVEEFKMAHAEICAKLGQLMMKDSQIHTLQLELDTLKNNIVLLSSENSRLETELQKPHVQKNVAQVIEKKQETVEGSEGLLASNTIDSQMGTLVDQMKYELENIKQEKNLLQTEVMELHEQLEMAQTSAKQQKALAAQAFQIAEERKTCIEEKEEEAKILLRCIDELESTVHALEAQVDMVRGESEKQRITKENLEAELQALKQYMSPLNYKN